MWAKIKKVVLHPVRTYEDNTIEKAHARQNESASMLAERIRIIRSELEELARKKKRQKLTAEDKATATRLARDLAQYEAQQREHETMRRNMERTMADARLAKDNVATFRAMKVAQRTLTNSVKELGNVDVDMREYQKEQRKMHRLTQKTRRAMLQRDQLDQFDSDDEDLRNTDVDLDQFLDGDVSDEANDVEESKQKSVRDILDDLQ